MKLRTTKILKMILIILVTATIIMPNFAYAEGIKFGDADAFIQKGIDQSGKNGLNQDDLKNVGTQFSDIAKILTYIGAGILVAATAYMGIKYMTASPEQQGKLKQQLIGLVVSAIVIFGAYFIWSTIYDLLDSAF